MFDLFLSPKSHCVPTAGNIVAYSKLSTMITENLPLFHSSTETKAKGAADYTLDSNSIFLSDFSFLWDVFAFLNDQN